VHARRGGVRRGRERQLGGMTESMRRVGLSWWRDGLGGGEVLPPLPARDEEPEEEDGVEGLTHHFSRVFNRLDVSGRAPAAHHDAPLAATRRAAEFQYRGPDLTRTLPPDLKARLAALLTRARATKWGRPPRRRAAPTLGCLRRTA
jgi:hypothetical protein